MMASRDRLDAEVLVVGASLAGLCAAYAAARDGVRTLLIDAAPEVGDRPNPATVLMDPLWRRTGLPIPELAIERELSGLKLGGPSGRGPTFRLRAFHLDRRVFDKSFAAIAERAGAEVRGNVRVTGVLPSGGVDTDSAPLRARATIFADGAGSVVRNVLPTMRNPWEVAWGLDQLLEGPDLGESPYLEVRFGSLAPGWRAQLNPLGKGRASLWTFARGVPRDEIGFYAERARGAFSGADRARIVTERRGADPSFVIPGRIAGDGILACGAAAGQGGLEYGARAGLLAGEIAAGSVRAGDASRQSLGAYEKAWRRETAREHRVVRWGMESLRRLSDAELDELFGAFEGIEFGEETLSTLLRGDPRAILGKAGAGRVTRAAAKAAQGWIRAASQNWR